MASSAAAASTRAVSLSRFFSSAAPTAKLPAPTPAPRCPPTPKPPAADALQNSRRAVLRRIIQETDPDKLVAKFIAASTASPPFRNKPHIYQIAVSRLASLGRRDGVEAILDAQKPFLAEKGLASRLIGLYGRASMPSRAAATFRDLPEQHKSTVNFNALLAAYSEAGDLDALDAAFREIPASHPSVVPDVSSYNVLLHALCRKPDLPAALDVLKLMEKRGISPDIISFNTMLNGYYNNGRMDDAERVWEMMKDRNLQPDAKCYNAKLRGLVAQGRVQDAVLVLQKMEKDGPKPNTVSYNELIRGFSKDGRLEEAKKLYDDLINNECAPNKGTFESLLPHLLRTGQLDCALRYCHEIFRRSCRVDCSMLQDVVNALVEASRMEEATKIVELGLKKNYHPWKGLTLLHTGHDDEVQAETDEPSISEEKSCEDEEHSDK